MAKKEKHIEKALKFIQKGNIAKAIIEYQAVVDMDPSDVSARLRLGDLHVKSDDPEKAIEIYTNTAKIHTKKGFYLKAIAVYKQILKLDDNLELHHKLADLYTKQRLFADAMREYTYIVTNFEKKGLDKEAFELIKEMVKIDPDNLGVRIKLADMMRKLGYKEDAVAEYCNILESHIGKKHYDKAMAVLEDLYRTHPTEVRVLHGFTDICRKKKDKKGYLKYASELVHVYDALESKEDIKEDAVKLCKTILALDAKNAVARALLDELEPSEKKKEPAKKEAASAEEAVEEVEAEEVETPVVEEEAEPEEEAPVAEPAVAVESAVEEEQVHQEEEEEVEFEVSLEEDEETGDAAGELEVELEEEPEVEIAEEVEEPEPEVEIAEEPEIEAEVEVVDEVVEEIAEIEEEPLVEAPAEAAEEPEVEPEVEPEEEIEAEPEVEESATDLPEEPVLEFEGAEVEEEGASPFDDMDDDIGDDLFDGVMMEEGEESDQDEGEDFSDLAKDFGVEEALDNLLGSWGEDDDSDVTEEFREGVGRQLGSEDKETHHNLGIAYMEMELFDDAVTEFKMSVSDPALVFDAYTRLGLCSLSLEKTNDAIEYYLKALGTTGSSDEDRKGIWYELALAYEKAGKMLEATEMYTSVQDVDPDYREVGERLVAITELEGAIPRDDDRLEVELL